MIPPWTRPEAILQSLRIQRSFHQWLGKELIPTCAEPLNAAAALFRAEKVVVSHGVEADPVLNYGNAKALELWEMTWEEFVQTPSRMTAEPVEQEERARLLGEVRIRGYTHGYAGVRVSRRGRRFRISGATVWNLVDDAGAPAGQAAAFDCWEFL